MRFQLDVLLTLLNVILVLFCIHVNLSYSYGKEVVSDRSGVSHDEECCNGNPGIHQNDIDITESCSIQKDGNAPTKPQILVEEIGMLLPLDSLSKFHPLNLFRTEVNLDESKNDQNTPISVANIPGGEIIDLRYVQNFLSLNEAQTFIQICNDRNGWTSSPLNHGEKKGGIKDENVARTSNSCPILYPSLYLPHLERLRQSGRLTPQLEKEINFSLQIMRRIASLLNVDESFIEPLQLIKYQPGQYYRKHHDHGTYYGSTSEQRPITFLLFLTDVPASDGGGHTKFDELGISVLPRAGDGIVWRNTRQNTKGERMEDLFLEALHQAVPPKHDGQVVKYAMNVWISQYNVMEDMNSKRLKNSHNSQTQTSYRTK
mmetsp:Transcript_21156/g.29634  ORF Transcript_21156/g.29634 Transcript_21156/m.29634 type:complete len:373 (+) Transcript_21156:56-1174(+)